MPVAPTIPTRVTVIPADRLIVVDGQPLSFTFAVPSDLHALHWDGKTVAVERISGDGQMDNARYSAAAYDSQVAPFVALWQAEQDRLETIANTPPPPPDFATKAAHLADVRWQAEQGGTVEPSLGEVGTHKIAPPQTWTIRRVVSSPTASRRAVRVGLTPCAVAGPKLL